MAIVLTSISLLSAFALSQVFLWAAPKIEANKELEIKNSVFEVVEGAKNFDKLEDKDFRYFKVYSEDKSLIGYAFIITGNGFQGKITVIAGVSPDFSKMKAIKVIDHSETPGLGDIITKDWYSSQFKDLKLNPNIGWVKEGFAKKDNEIYAKTGATISSKSVVAILNDGLDKLKANLGK
jgi:electron transport complex protein RnfG